MVLLSLLFACASTPRDKADDPVSAPDADGDGDPDASDCAPDDPAVHAGADEVCDGLDDDCDGTVDAGLTSTWYVDGDGDGWGTGDLVEGCDAPGDAAGVGGDCDDADPETHPDATERCDERDDDCDGEVDEDIEPPEWWVDADGDGYGVAGSEVTACDPGPGWAELAGDCDDAEAAVNPAAAEDCNARDDDCSGVIDDGDAVCPCPVEHRGDHAYLFCSVGSDWSSAKEACEGSGYHLVTVDDAAEDDWLSATASAYATGYWWTGANDRDVEGTWTWVDGTPWSYSNFCPGEPNNSHGLECVPTTEEDCGVLSWGTGGCWNDYPCDCAAAQGDPYRYICES